MNVSFLFFEINVTDKIEYNSSDNNRDKDGKPNDKKEQ